MREDLQKRLADVRARLAEVKAGRPAAEVQEQIDKLTMEVAAVSAALTEESKKDRKAELEKLGDERSGRDLIKLAELEQNGRKAIDEIMAMEHPKDEEIADAQSAVDNAYLLGFLLDVKPTSTRYFQRRLLRNPLLQKAINLADLGNAGVGGALTGWQPAEFSAQMIATIRLANVVEQLHPSFDLPEDPFRFRVEGPDPSAYVVAEQAATDAELTAGNRVPEGMSTLGTGHITFSTKKVGLRQTTSNEVTEDSAVAILDYLRNKMVLAHANMHENATVNGDAAGTLDSGITYGTTHQLLGWDGYRKIVNTLSSKVTATAGLVNLADTRKVRQEMGLLGLRPADTVLLCGPVGYIKLLGVTEVITVDKHGPTATVLSGELARLDGVPIVISGFVGGGAVGIASEALNVSGIYNGTTTTFTELLWVNRSSFTYARRRGLSLKSREIIDTDQQVLVTLERLTFKSWYPTLKPVGALVGITK